MKSFSDSIAFIDEEAERLKTALLFRNAGIAQWVTVVNASLLAYVNVTLGALPVLAWSWCAGACLMAMLRWHQARRFERIAPNAFQSMAWRRRYLVTTAAAAAVWASGSVVFIWHGADAAGLFTGLVFAGMVAGAVPLLAPVPKAFRVYALTLTLPMVLAVFAQAHSALHVAFGLMALVFLGAMLKGANYLHESLDEATRLGLANARIEDHLERAQGLAKSALSDRLAAVSTLEIQEERYRLILQNLPTGIVRFNRELKVTYSNVRLAQILQVALNDVVGFDLKTLRNAKLLTALRRAVEGEPSSYEGEFRPVPMGKVAWIALTCLPLDDGEGEDGDCIAVVDDISKRRQAESEIQRLAFTDPLTDLPNRRLLGDRLKQALAAATRTGHCGALLLIDLDQFKTLNDTLGHDIGDLLLRQVGERLKDCVREGDTVARLGGDEFVLMLEDLDKNAHDAAAQAQTVGEKIIAMLSRPYQLGSHVHHSTPSIGITVFDGSKGSIDDLLKQADLAMYQAKAGGRNTMRFFNSDMQTVMMARIALEADIRKGLVRREFHLFYQPQVSACGHLLGAEALLRWQHPHQGWVTPTGFITLAEETGLILPLGEWVLEEACRQLVLWSQHPQLMHISVAVNVSVLQFSQANFVAQLLAILQRTGANPHRLKLELTESLLANNVDEIAEKMFALKARGIGFSLDDFGTGYSSLSYLKRLPLDQLKIDQSFVNDILVDSNDAAIAKMVVALARSMGLAVIAEGVETQAQREHLFRIGCRNYQGYLFGRPVPVPEFEQLAGSFVAADEVEQQLLPI